MKILVLFLALICAYCHSVEVSDKLLYAIEMVESNCNENAVGDNGKAVGAYQQHAVFVCDVNRILKEDLYTLEDRKSAFLARRMAKIYLTYYGNRYERITGKRASNEVLARIYNGGATGYKKQATKSYWNKIKKFL